MTEGHSVTLIAYGGTTIVRTLVAVENGYLFVCKREEWEAAIEDRRNPVCIGFRVEDMVSPGRIQS